MNRYSIEFKSAYMGENDYTVCDRIAKKEFRIHYRTSTSDYLESIYNGTRAEYEKNIIGNLFFVLAPHEYASDDLKNAFVEYCNMRWQEYLEHCKKQIEKNPSDPIIAKIYTAGPASPLVRGIKYF